MKDYSRIIAVLGPLFTVIAITLIEVQFLEDYGWTLFILTPVLIGFLPAFIERSYHDDAEKRVCYNLSFVTLFFSLIGLLLFAMEGIVCIVMTLPLTLLLVWWGSHLGYKAAKGWSANKETTTLLVLLTCGLFMSFDYINEPGDLIPVRTKVVIAADIHDVWNNVVTFDTITEPTDWIFTTGISYPIDATIVGEGTDAIRYCNFTTGSFVEPITNWDEPNLLQFSVIDQPIPMNEYNPFWDIHPPHLDGYFKSYKGQFKLTQLENGTVELEGTTWYKVDIMPVAYWSVWTDFILHKIHLRVLNHIKLKSEAGDSSGTK